MCELLGLNANVPTDICFSFSGLLERGGRTGNHTDGWGIGFYEDNGCRLFHDPEPCSDSLLAQLIADYPIKSNIIISHIRKANRGKVKLENTHPFSRELWGKQWTFAHNGQLKGVKKMSLGRYQPLGTTDSEHAFCWILSQIEEKFPLAPPRSSNKLRATIHSLCQQLSELGVFNILMSDSKQLFAFCTSKMNWISRRAPFGEAKLVDKDMSIDFGNETTPSDVVTVIATTPLTDNEHWNEVTNNQLHCFYKGECLTSFAKSSLSENL
ncbi:MAG: class II glutamine amidotransferase [Acidiferrobacterales bacterium]|nr:class II glutamine amidotransferase [Acidiferrobacterales bacterium]